MDQMSSETRTEMPAFLKLLETAAIELKNGRPFTTELSPNDLKQMVFQMMEQYKEEMQQKGIAAQIGRLDVDIANGKGKVDTNVKASKRVLFKNVDADITARFGLENVVGEDGKPTGEIETTHLEVTPETLFVIIKPIDFLAPKVQGREINGTFFDVLDSEMQSRGAKIHENGLYKEFTPQNTFKIVVTGGTK